MIGKKVDVFFNIKILEKINEFIMKYNKLLMYFFLYCVVIKLFFFLIFWFIVFVSIFVLKIIIIIFSICFFFGEIGNEFFKEK